MPGFYDKLSQLADGLITELNLVNEPETASLLPLTEELFKELLLAILHLAGVNKINHAKTSLRLELSEHFNNIENPEVALEQIKLLNSVINVVKKYLTIRANRGVKYYSNSRSLYTPEAINELLKVKAASKVKESTLSLPAPTPLTSSKADNAMASITDIAPTAHSFAKLCPPQNQFQPVVSRAMLSVANFPDVVKKFPSRRASTSGTAAVMSSAEVIAHTDSLVISKPRVNFYPAYLALPYAINYPYSAVNSYVSNNNSSYYAYDISQSINPYLTSMVPCYSVYSSSQLNNTVLYSNNYYVNQYNPYQNPVNSFIKRRD